MDRAVQYANSVVKGELVAGKIVIHACQRFLDDMKKQKTHDFPLIIILRAMQARLLNLLRAYRKQTVNN